MSNSILELKKKLGVKWAIFEKIHKILLSISPKIEYRVFPIYVSYYIGDINIAIIYFRGKFVLDDELDIGLRLTKKPLIAGLVDAKYMHYAGINYSIKLGNIKQINSEFSKLVKFINCTTKNE